MEAARVAAIRGHEVFLYDHHPQPGGLIPVAALLKDVEADDMLALVKWFIRQLNQLGVQVKLGRKVTIPVIRNINPEAIIVAAGGKNTIPDIAGITDAKVTTSARLNRQMKSLLRYFNPQILGRLTGLWMPVGRRVVIIGGRIHGCETAEFLVKRGREVIIVDGEDRFGEGMTGDDRARLLPWLDNNKVKRFLGVKYNFLTKGKLNITTSDGQNLTLEADTIITALPLSPNNDIMNRFRAKAPEVYFVGDCMDPKLIAEATTAAALVASKL
jgi:2,4-dienoyl-CoA reductase (NADPH2)